MNWRWDMALEFERVRGAQRMEEIGASADAAWNTGVIDALKEAVRAGRENWGEVGRCAFCQRSARPDVLVYGALLRGQDWRLPLRLHRALVGHCGHCVMVRSGPGAMGRGVEFLVLGRVFDKTR